LAESFLAPLIAASADRFVLRHRGSGQTIADTIETAFDSASRRRGLLGRDAFAPGSAMIIAPCNSIHTFFMRFPIDAAFVDRQGVVLKASAELVPWRVALSLRAFAVIELPAGTLARFGMTAGATLDVAAP